MEAEIITNYRCQIGEGPLWNRMENALYWVDIPGGRVLRYDPVTETGRVCYEGEQVHGLTVQEDGTLLLFIERGSVANLRDGELTIVIEKIPDFIGYGFNDMIADPIGRVYWGSIPEDIFSGKQECGLYRIELDGSATLVADGIGVSNGLGFSPDYKNLYYTDTMVRKIYMYDYDKESGDLSNRRVFLDVPDEEGDPDGMTVDADGYVWTALWGSSSVVRYNPQGIEDRRIRFPAMKISSVCFGGAAYTDVYATSAIAGPKGHDPSEAAGALFRVKGGIRGLPECFSRICV